MHDLRANVQDVCFSIRDGGLRHTNAKSDRVNSRATRAATNLLPVAAAAVGATLGICGAAQAGRFGAIVQGDDRSDPVISYVYQNRTVSAGACSGFGPCTIETQTINAPDFGAFDAVAHVRIAYAEQHSRLEPDRIEVSCLASIAELGELDYRIAYSSFQVFFDLLEPVPYAVFFGDAGRRPIPDGHFIGGVSLYGPGVAIDHQTATEGSGAFFHEFSDLPAGRYQLFMEYDYLPWVPDRPIGTTVGSAWFIIPSPGGAALAACAGVLAIRRRRRAAAEQLS